LIFDLSSKSKVKDKEIKCSHPLNHVCYSNDGKMLFVGNSVGNLMVFDGILKIAV